MPALGAPIRHPAFRLFRFLPQAFLVCGGVLLSASPGRSQSLAVLSGLVTDSADIPVYGAIVSLRNTSLTATSNERGEFRIVGVPTGSVEIRARRLGFTPVKREVRVASQESLNRFHIRLSALPTTVRPVVVHASRVVYTGRLAGYYERLRRRSSGHFIARAEIDRKDHRSLSQLLSQAPGINALRMRSGGGAVRMRGRSCRPLVWLDGFPMPAGEVDLDAFPVNTLHGIELYLGSTTAPSDYTATQGQSSCGTILLWSRGRDTEPPASPAGRSVDVEQMAASLAIYTSDQVDKPAELAGPGSLEVKYPPSLVAAGVVGSVVAEFVVDAGGKIETGTLAIVSSTHPLFSAAVVRALDGAAYTPAIRKGEAVRQVVQQPFSFARGFGKVADGGN